MTSTATQRWLLALTSTAALMVALDQLVVASALNQIRADLHASIATLDWTVNAYGLSFAVLLITGAALGDRYGRRRLFVLGLVLFTASSAVCALAPNTAVLITARTLQGVGSAVVMPLAVALLTAGFPAEKRGPVVGIFTALTGLAVVGGPVIGGAVTDGLAWQWIFWINVPIGALLVALVLVRIEESTGGRARIDLAGIALSSAGMLGLVWGLIRANDAGWASAEVIGTLVAGALCSVGFVLWERRTPDPMLPMHLFAIRSFAAGNAAMVLLTASLFSTVFFFAQYLQISLGYDALEAGVRFIPWTATLFVVAPLAGALCDRVGPRPLLAAGLFLQGVGLTWLAWNVTDARPYSSSILALMIAGCGTSMALPSGQTAVMNSVPLAFLGKASGAFNTSRQLGGVLGVSVLSAVFAANGSYASPESFRDGVGPAVLGAAGLAVAGAVAGLCTAGRRASATVRPVDEVPVGADVG